MKKDTLTLIGLWAVAALLFFNLFATLDEPKAALAQKDTPVLGRYQVSAWGSYTGGTTCHFGYYVVDTVTGKIIDKVLEEHKQLD
jgi:hypothetical protein